MDTLIYTFRTFPWKNELSSPFVLSKLKYDLEKLNQEILNNKPKLILGIAKSRKKYSTIESIAANKFNNFLINKTGKDFYELDIPPGLNLKINKDYTRQFCNYATYKISESLNREYSRTKHYFIHSSKNDLEKVLDYFSLNL